MNYIVFSAINDIISMGKKSLDENLWKRYHFWTYKHFYSVTN